MPSYADNSLEVEPADALAVAAVVKSERSAFDFNRVVPMPLELEDSDVDTKVYFGLAMLGVSYTKRGSMLNPEAILTSMWIKETGITNEMDLRELLRRDARAAQFEAAGRAAATLIAATGYANWYDWRIDHWGTQWNSIDVAGGLEADGRARFGFRTACDPPLPIIAKLSSMFPNSTFRLECYNDDYDDGQRHFVFRSGRVIDYCGFDSEGEPQLPDWSDIRAAIEQSKDADASNCE